MLYIIYGASGTGKERFVETIDNVPSFKLITKGTNRKRRDSDGQELQFVADEAALREIYDIVFPYYKIEDPRYFFGIRNDDLESANEDDDHIHFLFCNHFPTIEKITRRYEKVKVLFFRIDNYLDLYTQDKEVEPKSRIQRMAYLLDNANEKMSTFDHIIFYKVRPTSDRIKSTNDVRNQLFSIIHADSKCLEYEAAISNKVAVMMPQGEREFEKTHYNKVFKIIKKTVSESRCCSGRPFSAQRITNSDRIIINDIIAAIQQSNRVIVDLSQNRNNCYFEAGLAIAQNKKILLICDDKTTPSYNISAYNVIKYNIDSNFSQLEDIIREFMNESPDDSNDL